MSFFSEVSFGTAPDDTPISLFTLKNHNGIEARISNYGGTLVSLQTPDSEGALADIALGFDSVDGYIANPKHYFGSLIGRYANRIGQATFGLRGVKYELDRNDGQNTLHGGATGFDKRIWSVSRLPDGDLEFSYLSKDGECGFPGNLQVVVIYSLTEHNDLSVRYKATTDKETVINLTSHAYFNLRAGDPNQMLGHELTINSNYFTPVSEDLIPTGEYRAVEGTPFDFRESTPIGARIDEDEEQLKRARGYDHNWILNRTSPGLLLAARVKEPATGRILEVHTTEPGLQFYTGNFLNGTIKGKGGVVYGHRTGFCLETQHFPDSPNKPHFPSTLLQPGQQFQSLTIYRFLHL
jgi:aldose 1-epimerase